jgi:RHS repeat-associated protein
VRQVTDETGAVVSAREWTPYGVKVGGAQAGLGYTGEWQDPALGLQYLRARWYDSYLNQFVSPDPIVPDYRNPQSINGYTYALGNPVGYVDPSGEKPYCPEDPCIDPPKTCVKTFRFVVLPILREIRPTQWFGDTVFASNNRGLYNYSGGLHAGFDLAAPVGSNVYAGIYGSVVGAFKNSGVFSPNYVIIRPTRPDACECVNRIVLYGHIGSPSVEVGDNVGPVTLIGHVEATEGHLHLEIRDYEDDYAAFTANKWFYNPSYYMSEYWVGRLQAAAQTQSERNGVPSGLAFVGAYSDEIVHVFRSCRPLSERSDASINIIPSSGRHGQGRIGLSARLPLQIEPVGIVN